MFKVSASVDIERPVDQVFAFVADPHNQHVWQPGLHHVKAEGNVIVEVRKIMGRRVEHEYEVVDMAHNRHLIHRGRAKSHEGEATRHMRFEPIGDGKTHVTMELEVDTRGMLKSGEPVVERMLARDLRSDLEHLKDALEVRPEFHETLSANLEHHQPR